MREIYSVERLNKLSYKEYKRLMGIDRVTHFIMECALQNAYEKKHTKGGKPSKFSIHDKIVIFLIYMKNYYAMEDLAFQFKTTKSVICEIIHWIIDELLKNKNFTLFGSKCVKNEDSENRLIDVTEIRIERPKYNQKDKYSGKKKYHTMKIQIIKGLETGFIYEIQVGEGKEHDFHLFKRTFEGTPDNVTYEVDLGYLGIDKVHKNSKVPKKSSKNHTLTDEEVAYNKEIAEERIFIEHTNSWIKRFKILSTKFRNHLKYFTPIAVLICALYNINIA